ASVGNRDVMLSDVDFWCAYEPFVDVTALMATSRPSGQRKVTLVCGVSADLGCCGMGRQAACRDRSAVHQVTGVALA
ncbi:MAG: hypothetical protein ACTSP2_06655, partial [Alphaproteobacteria bacterium]